MLPPIIDWDVLTRHLAGETSEEENREVEEWAAASTKNQKQLEQLRKIWWASGKPATAPETNVDQALQEITRKIHFKTAQPIPGLPAETATSYTWLWRVAAGVVLALGVVFAFYRLQPGQKEQPLAYINYQTAPGKNVKLTLPDNSTVWLHGGSSLRYPKQFAANAREVTLQGEGFFEIKADQSKPFRIAANQTITEVLGTSFNVEAYPEQKTVTVSVVTGKVALRNQQNPETSVVLTPNQTGRFVATSGELISEATADLNFMAWRTGVLQFRNTSLETVARDLQKVYGRKIELRGKNLEKCRFTGTFEKQKLEEVLEVMRLTLNLQTEINDEKVVLIGEGC